MEIPMSDASTRLPRAEGPGSVSRAPNLPAGFADTFTSRYIDTGGLRLHAVIGGDGPPLLLVHGWPQTWYAWRMLMPALARDFEVVAVDQRGIGLSDKPRDGYDAGTLADDLVALMDALGHQRFAVFGTDTGMPIGYALAADHPDRVERLALAEVPGPPGGLPHRPCSSLRPLNDRLWHIAVQPARQGERAARPGTGGHLLRHEFAASAGSRKLPDDAVKYYVEALASDPDALRGSFAFYRELDTMIAQNEERKTRPLTMPVLAIGGEESGGEGVGDAMKPSRTTCRAWSSPAPATGSPRRPPRRLLAALTAFLAPYRDGATAAHVAPCRGR